MALDPPPRERATLDFLIFGLAAFGKGRRARFLERSRAVSADTHPAIRYRAMIRIGAFAEARRIRRGARHDPAVLADFRWTLAHAALWSHRLDRGLRLYEARKGAQNFPKLLP